MDDIYLGHKVLVCPHFSNEKEENQREEIFLKKIIFLTVNLTVNVSYIERIHFWSKLILLTKFH
jgi:hypothetical protein